MFKNRILINPEIIRAIFFDFDGVILESVEVKTQAFKTLFADHPPAEVEKFLEFHERHGGVSRMEKITHFYKVILGQELSLERHRALCDHFRDLALQNVLDSPFVSGALEFLENNFEKFDFFVISGTPQEELREIVQKRGLSKYFKELLGSPIRKPVHVAALLNKYGYTKDQVIFVGDSLTDFEAALSEKLLFVSV